MKTEDLKLVVKEKYGEIAKRSLLQTDASCCGPAACCDENFDAAIFVDTYSTLEGYNPDADLKLGCGMPTEFAGIKSGDSVLDLGSGAGNDCFVARKLVGDKGKVTGLDFTDEMIEKARKNVKKTGFKNIDFVKGDIENMPLPENEFDVVISNCVLNLVPDKEKAFKETYRVLKPGGHFCVSDVVIKGELPKAIRKSAEMYVGCIAGAEKKEDYLEIIKKAGFSTITVFKEEHSLLPDSLVKELLSEKEYKQYKNGEFGTINITVSGTK
ncbi:MAG: arsenite methyltransferase [Draconibacterium sp.]|nr:arsenite methyltransferase [Draconibacterium sp.]